MNERLLLQKKEEIKIEENFTTQKFEKKTKRMRSVSSKAEERLHQKNKAEVESNGIVDVQRNSLQQVDTIDIHQTSIDLQNSKNNSNSSTNENKKKNEPPAKRKKTNRVNSVEPPNKDEMKVSDTISNVSPLKPSFEKIDGSISNETKVMSEKSGGRKPTDRKQNDIPQVVSTPSSPVMDVSSQSDLEVHTSGEKWIPLINVSKTNSSCPNGSIISSGDWFHAKKHGSWCNCQSHILIISYDMCEVSNSLTGTKEETIVRFSMLNADNPSEVAEHLQ